MALPVVDGSGASCGVGFRSSFFGAGAGLGDFLVVGPATDEDGCFFGLSFDFSRSAKGLVRRRISRTSQKCCGKGVFT